VFICEAKGGRLVWEGERERVIKRKEKMDKHTLHLHSPMEVKLSTRENCEEFSRF
jgi:hypothetical protein